MKRVSCLIFVLFAISCGGGGGSGDDEGGETTEALAEIAPAAPRSEVLRSCGLVGGPLRIMPLGDSVTESEAGQSSYRLPLWNALLGVPCSVDFVGSRRGVSTGRRDSPQVSPANPDFDQDHEGHWDYRTDEILARIDFWAAQAQPDVVLIHLGTNDIFQGQDVGSTIAEIAAIIDRLRLINPNIAVAVAQVIPSRRQTGGLESLNMFIPGLVEEKNTPESPVVLANHAAGYFVSDNFDGIHPGPSGEAKMADTWLNSIMELQALAEAPLPADDFPEDS